MDLTWKLDNFDIASLFLRSSSENLNSARYVRTNIAQDFLIQSSYPFPSISNFLYCTIEGLDNWDTIKILKFKPQALLAQ